MQEKIAKAVETLQQGGVILYPTDTIWGIGCDATDEKAVKKIYQLKQREVGKSMLILLDTVDKLPIYVKYIPTIVWKLLEKYKDQPTTIIYPQAQNLASNILAEDGSIGIRITQEKISRQLIKTFGKPIVSTSANVSGEKFPEKYDDINSNILNTVNFILKPPYFTSSNASPSKVIKVHKNNSFDIIRK